MTDLAAGQTVTLTASATGGTGPYTYVVTEPALCNCLDCRIVRGMSGTEAAS